MAVRICTKTRNCFTCTDKTVDNVSTAVQGAQDAIFCCNIAGPAAQFPQKHCVRVEDIDTWGEPAQDRPDERPEGRMLDLTGVTSIRIDYR